MELGLQQISRLLLFIAGLACVAMLALINFDVLLKYTANQPIPGTLECVAFYFMPLIVFCSFAHVQQHRHNIEISLFTDLLPRRIAAIIENAARVLSLAYL
ncbi:MAG: TRAP transporter small permease subunit, partial [Hyphomicrobium sp.]|nr:TRAP transporter small permease subunit [Hyphomicrobium sp.]